MANRRIHKSSSCRRINSTGFRKTGPPQRSALLESTPGRIPEIDGLRGLAAAMVVLVHAFYAYWPFRWGYLGVDLFFVISGFVITRMLLVETRNGQAVDLRRFYRRRFWRLMPALVLAVTFGSLAFFLHAYEQTTSNFLLQITAALLFSMNVLTYFGSDYDAVAKVLGVTWSLSVEEHFYLTWPLIFAWIARPRFAGCKEVMVRRAGGIIYVTASLIFLLETWLQGTTGEAIFTSSFFHTECRLGEIGLGCVVATLPSPGSKARLRRIAATLWLLAITLAVTQLSALAVTFAATACAALGSGAFLWANFGDDLASRALRSKPASVVGAASYEWYLFHIPILTLFGLWHVRPGVHTVAGVLVSLLVAIGVERSISRPLRRLGRRPAPAVTHGSPSSNVPYRSDARPTP